jgi:hypothetical protein
MLGSVKLADELKDQVRKPPRLALAGFASPPETTISKSKFLSGLQCPKLLWHLAKAPAELPAVAAATQAIFDQGAEVGRLAGTLFPGGILIDNHGDPEQAIIDTQRALDARKPVFEGSFAHSGASCRVDILIPVGLDQWDLIEVKSTTGVEDVHLHDVAFQAWVVAGAELKLRLCWVMHLDSGYVRHGDLDPAHLFQRVAVTSQVQAPGRDIEDQLDDMAAVIREDQSPEVEIGKKCDAPYPCPLKEKCWSFLPDHSVFRLYRGGNRSWQLFRDRIHAISDIPDDFKLTTNQAIQRRAVRTGKPHIERSAIRRFLERLTYPVHYVDFETINPAIPMYNGTSPYQQLPFQFSLHIQADPDADPVHHSFLAAGAADPRREFLESLVRHIGPAGSVRMLRLAAGVPAVAGRRGAAHGRSAGALPGFSLLPSGSEGLGVDESRAAGADGQRLRSPGDPGWWDGKPRIPAHHVGRDRSGGAPAGAGRTGALLCAGHPGDGEDHPGVVVRDQRIARPTTPEFIRRRHVRQAANRSMALPWFACASWPGSRS